MVDKAVTPWPIGGSVEEKWEAVKSALSQLMLYWAPKIDTIQNGSVQVLTKLSLFFNNETGYTLSGWPLRPQMP